MVECSDCGFLTMRGSTGEFIEIDGQFRAGGNPEADSPLFRAMSSRADADNVPMCFAQEFDLAGETKGGPQLGKDNRASSHTTIETDRECRGWMKWQQGSTPREHRDKQDRVSVTEREDKRDQEMRGREDARDSKVEARETERDRASRGRHRSELWVFGGVIAIATLLGSIIQAGWIERPW